MGNTGHKILVVDDSPISLLLMQRVLRSNYHVFTATDGQEALEVLKNEDISLLISDQRMPGMSGIELLQQGKRINSDLVGMLVTANTDNDTSFEAINSAGALRVIHKPWDRQRVIQFVQEALIHRDTLLECKQANSEIEHVMNHFRRRELKVQNDGSIDLPSTASEQQEDREGHAKVNSTKVQVTLLLSLNGAIETQKFEFLARENVDLIVVRSIDELLDLLAGQDAPSIVIIDASSSDFDTCQTCRTIRAGVGGAPIYIILIVADNSDDRRLYKEADDWITSHVSPAELLARVETGCRFIQLKREVEHQVSLTNEMFRRLESNSVTVTQLSKKLLTAISDRTRAEEELRLQKILLESQSEASLDGVLVVSSEGKIISFNNRFIEIWNLAQEMAKSEYGDVILQAISDKLDKPKEFLKLVKYHHKYPAAKTDKELSLKDGRIFHYYNAPVVSSDRVSYGRAYYFRDITERKTLENQLRQAQKLESVGQLAAGIAHEINTPTQYVSDNTRFLRDAFQDIAKVCETSLACVEALRNGVATPELLADFDAAVKDADLEFLTSEIPKALNQSLEGTQRISKIVQSMKDFAHPGIAVKQACDLNRAIESTVTVACGEWKYVAQMVTDLDPTLPLVPCLQGEFNQVVLNMITNAAHAIGDVVGDGAGGKGTITISTRKIDSWAEIRISDTGAGIPEANRARIFDPFFTTKQVGKGTGQGLAISHNVIVEKHGGTIMLETALGVGTTFIIRLPLQETS